MHHIWNVFASGTVASFEVTDSQWPRAHLRLRTGKVLDALLDRFNLPAGTGLELSCARWRYNTDEYDEATEAWEDRWRPVVLLNVTLSQTSVVRDLLPAAESPDLWDVTDRAAAAEKDEADHDTAALLVADFPRDVPLPDSLVQQWQAAGRVCVRDLDGPASLSRLQPMKQLRAKVPARFPGDLARLDLLLRAAKDAGGSIHWIWTHHPNNT